MAVFERGQKVRVTEKYKATPNPFDGGMEVAPGTIGEVEFALTKGGDEWSDREDEESDLEHYSVIFPNGHWDSFHPDQIEAVD